MKFQSPKGTRDFYPADMAVRNWIFDAWRRVSHRHGFEEYDGPIFESLDLYKAKSGEGIVSELFHFTDRGDRELAIRPEMTPTLARMIIARAQSLPRPIKWFSIPRLCRAERPQRGRLREFFQWNIDIVGLDDAVSDAECIFVAVDFFRDVGLTPADMVMRINSRSLLSALLIAQGIQADRHPGLFALLDRKDKVPEAVFTELLEQQTQSDAERQVLRTLGQARGETGLADLEQLAAGNETALRELERIREVFALLSTLGVVDYCEFDMGIVRGLAYYTGIVFEGFGKGELKRAICGGGRYDELLRVLGGPAMSGIGFATSDVVVQDVLADLKRLPASAMVGRAPDFFVVDAEPRLFVEVLRLVAELRRRGYQAAFSYKRQPLGKQLGQAASGGAVHAVILGSEYTQRRVVAVKNLAREQQVEVGLDAFLADPAVAVGSG